MLLKIFLFAILGILCAFALFLTLCALCVNPQKIYQKDSPFYRAVSEWVVDAILRLFRIHVTVLGSDKLPEADRVLFVGNHRSNFDPMVTWIAFRGYHPAFLSKGANMRIPVVGRMIRRCCFMEIDRENPRNAIKTIHAAAALLSRREVSVGVYPEGTRSKDGTLLPFHNGVFKIAQKANAPIVVLAISGTEQIHKNAPFRKTEVVLEVSEVLTDISHTKTAEIGARVRCALENSPQLQ